MKDSLFYNISENDLELTVEEFLRKQFQNYIEKFLQHSQERIENFQKEAEKVKKEFQEIMGISSISS